jgi:ferredoxin-NADP reductase
VLLLSGGVGITPVMSMARWWFDTNAEVDIHFVHSARTPKDLVFYRELQHMDSRLNNIHLSLICERTDIGETWSGYRGYLSGTMLSLIAPDFMDREIFCCGPAPYMKAVRTLLQHAGFDMDHYHEESFGATPVEIIEDVEQLAQEASELAEELERTEDRLTISFLESDLQVDIMPGETLHSAAAQVGLHIPKACGMGICGTCKVKVTKGEVAMEHNGGITDEDVAEGYVLSCCSVPSGNVEVAF